MPIVNNSYSIDREFCVWQGVNIHEGFDEGNDVMAETLEGNQGWSQKPNGVGGVVQIYNPAERGTIAIKVSMEHPIHTILKALAERDKLLRDVVGPMMRQRSSGERIVYEDARIMQIPPETTGTESGVATWVFLFARRKSQRPGPALNNVVARSV